MKISLAFTPFSRMFRPLSIYSEQSRAEGPATKVKWKVDDGIRIFGYDHSNFQTRLSVIRLDGKRFCEPLERHPDFSTEIPRIRGLSTATGGNDIQIETEPGQKHLTIGTDDFSYNIGKSLSAQHMGIRQHYLPMENLTLRGAISSSILKKYFHMARTKSLRLKGPLRLKISDADVKFVTKGDDEKSVLNLTDNVTLYSNREKIEYTYELRLLVNIFKKLPSKERIELFANDDLIRFRFELGDNLGYVNYYQRGK